MLVGEYESLSKEGKIGNTYEAGQLNIIRYPGLAKWGLFAIEDVRQCVIMGYAILWLGTHWSAKCSVNSESTGNEWSVVI